MSDLLGKNLYKLDDFKLQCQETLKAVLQLQNNMNGTASGHLAILVK